MIVRIMTDEQYRLDDSHLAEVQRLDNVLDDAEQRGDAVAFTAALHDLTVYVHQYGKPVPIDEVVASDLIIPAPDMTLQEAKERLQVMEARAAAVKTTPEGG